MENDFIFNFDDTSSDIESICLNCGLEEKVPDFIYDEMGSRVKHKELKTNQKVSTIIVIDVVNLKLYQNIG